MRVASREVELGSLFSAGILEAKAGWYISASDDKDSGLDFHLLLLIGGLLSETEVIDMERLLHGRRSRAPRSRWPT
jgi:hypothetical protein